MESFAVSGVVMPRLVSASVTRPAMRESEAQSLRSGVEQSMYQAPDKIPLDHRKSSRPRILPVGVFTMRHLDDVYNQVLVFD